MAIFAPNANSYRRLIPDNFAPLSPNWGYNHRCVSLRIPVSSDENRRIEHRAAGADANPYLVMAAVLAGIQYGLEHRSDPGRMVEEGEHLVEGPATLPRYWPDALKALEASDFARTVLGADFHPLFTTIRRKECEDFAATIADIDYRWYLRSV
jgi:glutamine synthetase